MGAKMFRIVDNAGNVESHLDTMAAAERRAKMLRKNKPGALYRIEEKLAKVTVTPISANDTTAIQIRRAA